jgi:hypothetical protein
VSAPREPPPINHVLKVILAVVLMGSGFLSIGLIGDATLRWVLSLLVGLVAMLLLVSGLRGMAQVQKNKANGTD